jgi:hypothetical protein
METSIIDQYYNMIRNDRKYFDNYLKIYGTEIHLMTPKNTRQLNDYKIAFGAATFANDVIKYNTTITHMIIADLDLDKVENMTNAQYQVIIPYRLYEGSLIQYDHLFKTYTLEVGEIIESIEDYIYRCILRLNNITSRYNKNEKESNK